ncbi:hypothetical protein PR048_011957 [Dryococelus australis]|uniref:Uncharacterized protein n=1 Tax=Dryococelus australis TaxID=614101 RepID=A0ABQ9HND3_9NEOP|nr:hypothetical protein PR048_011957 [Dryococelus australis]
MPIASTTDICKMYCQIQIHPHETGSLVHTVPPLYRRKCEPSKVLLRDVFAEDSYSGQLCIRGFVNEVGACIFASVRRF